MKKIFTLILLAGAVLCLAETRHARAMQPAAGTIVVQEEEQTFTVVLTDVGTSMVKVVKAIRTGLGIELKDAYALANSLPATLKADVTAEEALKLQKEIEAAGGKVKVSKAE